MTDRSKMLSSAIIKVIGVGGGGGNAINTMIESGLEGVEFIAANTDIQALQSNKAPIKIQLGRELTKGLGAGANPDVGHDAALEDKAIIQEVIGEADMVFVTAGMGGGTGTGAAPVIAQVAREMGALTVGVVTKPFIFEGKKRRIFGEKGILQLRASVDTLITIPNQRLLAIAPPSMSMLDGFRLADDVLLNAVKGISEIINIPGRINVDFADVKTVMAEMGMALMGTGIAHGSNRATEAAQAAISSPLLEDVDIEGATGLLINITGPENMTLHEISVASSLIQEAAHEDANIILGAAIDNSLQDELRVTVIATGFDQAYVAPPEKMPQTSAPRTNTRESISVNFPLRSPSVPEKPSQVRSEPLVEAAPVIARDDAEELMKLTLEMADSRQDERRHSAPPSPQWSAHQASQSSARNMQSDEGPRFTNPIPYGPSEGENRSGAVATSHSEPRTDIDGSYPERETAASRNSADAGPHGHRDSQEGHRDIDSLTEKAMRIAQEFAEEEELERPAFLRKREIDRPLD